jgi:hypothetical protein
VRTVEQVQLPPKGLDWKEVNVVPTTYSDTFVISEDIIEVPPEVLQLASLFIRWKVFHVSAS